MTFSFQSLLEGNEDPDATTSVDRLKWVGPLIRRGFVSETC